MGEGMKFLFLNELFYMDYSECIQIERKQNRPYVQVYMKIDNVQFLIPLRSNITHKDHVLWTDKENKCGLDFSKAVVLTDEKYINYNLKPYIRDKEFDFLRGKEYIIKQKLIKHIAEYKKAKSKLHIRKYKLLCDFSTMQYFEKYIENVNL